MGNRQMQIANYKWQTSGAPGGPQAASRDCCARLRGRRAKVLRGGQVCYAPCRERNRRVPTAGKEHAYAAVSTAPGWERKAEYAKQSQFARAGEAVVRNKANSGWAKWPLTMGKKGGYGEKGRIGPARKQSRFGGPGLPGLGVRPRPERAPGGGRRAVHPRAPSPGVRTESCETKPIRRRPVMQNKANLADLARNRVRRSGGVICAVPEPAVRNKANSRSRE